jgi:GGDEF domain-containing protein
MSRRVSEDRDLLEHAAGTDAPAGLLNRRSFDDDMRTCIHQQRLARLLESFESEECRFYRLGGEEFVALFTGSKTDATGLAEAGRDRVVIAAWLGFAATWTWPCLEAGSGS